MPYNDLKDGIYIIKRPATKLAGFIDHYGILDVGNVFKHPNSNGFQPIVYHQLASGLTLQWLQDTGTWAIEGRMQDQYITDARHRLNKAYQTPAYDLFGNNCEHFARFIAEGEKYSTQLRATAVIAGLCLLVYFIFKDDKE